MSGKKKTIDVSGYRATGSYHWSDFTGKGNYDPGKANLKPRVEFLHPDGYSQPFYDHDRKTVVYVQYDENYVFNHYFQKIVVSNGWVDEEGNIRKDILRMFLDRFYDYACLESERVKTEKLEQQIKQMVSITGKSEEEVRAFLLGEQEKREVENINLPEVHEIEEPIKNDAPTEIATVDAPSESIHSETKRGRGRPPKMKAIA